MWSQIGKREFCLRDVDMAQWESTWLIHIQENWVWFLALHPKKRGGSRKKRERELYLKTIKKGEAGAIAIVGRGLIPSIPGIMSLPGVIELGIIPEHHHVCPPQNIIGLPVKKVARLSP